MTALHTKGPWRYSPWHIEEAPSAVYDAENNLVCTTSSDDTARLIAAAPDMLEALRNLMRHMPDYADTVWIDAQAAIARATGAKP